MTPSASSLLLSLLSNVAIVGVAAAANYWFLTRHCHRRVLSASREFSGFAQQMRQIADAELDEIERSVAPLVQEQVSLAMSEVLAAMAEAEQQRALIVQAEAARQAQAEELARLRATAAGNAQQGDAVAQAITEINSRMAAFQEKMRQVGAPPTVSPSWLNGPQANPSTQEPTYRLSNGSIVKGP